MRYKLLGRSGLRVSELALGTMTFGTDWGWGADEAESRRMFGIFAEAGGNFLDTANVYTQGTSERYVGAFIASDREHWVVGTKYTLAALRPDDPNASGNHRKSMMQSIEASLKRLGTDYIDLYQLHGFDAMTPLEEVMQTLDDLVRVGKIRYIGCSNFSGWHLMKSLAVSEKYGLARHVAHQAYYSLVGRDYEWELMPLALDQGVGTVVWSPLAWGRLGGKFRRGQPLPKDTRLASPVTAQRGPQVPEEYLYRVVDALDAVAAETGKSVAQVALNWLLRRPSVATIVMGARNEAQLRQNLGAVGWKLTPAQIAKLDAASAVPLAYPYWHQRTIYGERNPPPV